MTPDRRRSLASAGFVFLFSVAAVALLGTTLFSLAQNVIAGRVPLSYYWQHVPMLTIVPGPSTPDSRQPFSKPIAAVNPDDLSPLTIVLDRVVPSRGVVEGTITVDMSCEQLRNIVDKETKAPIF